MPEVIRPSTNEEKVAALIKASRGKKKLTAAQIFYKVGVECTNGDVMAEFFLEVEQQIAKDDQEKTEKEGAAASDVKREHDETIASIIEGKRLASELLVPELKRILYHRLGTKATNKLKNKASLLHAWREERLKDATPCSDAEACEPVTSQSLLRKVEGRPVAVWWFDDEVHGDKETDMSGQWWHGIAHRKVGNKKLMVKYNESQPHHLDYCHSSSGEDSSDEDSSSDDASSSEGAAADRACEVCGCTDGAATMLLCDLCELGWHCACLVPPLAGVPDDEWFCQSCSQDTQGSGVRAGNEARAASQEMVIAVVEEVGATVKLQANERDCRLISQPAKEPQVPSSTGMSMPGIIRRTEKLPKCAAIAARIRMLEGKTQGQCDGLRWTNTKGQQVVYKDSDLRYDLRCGYISIDGEGRDPAIPEGQAKIVTAVCDATTAASPGVVLLGHGQRRMPRSLKVKGEPPQQAQGAASQMEAVAVSINSPLSQQLFAFRGGKNFSQVC